jgi:hypothetical protein
MRRRPVPQVRVSAGRASVPQARSEPRPRQTRAPDGRQSEEGSGACRTWQYLQGWTPDIITALNDERNQAEESTIDSESLVGQGQGAGVRCQVSGGRWQVSGGRWQNLLAIFSGSAGHQPRNSGGSVTARVKNGAGAPCSQREDCKQLLRSCFKKMGTRNA